MSKNNQNTDVRDEVMTPEQETQEQQPTIEVVKKKTIGERLAEKVDGGKAFVRKHWRKIAVGLVGVATAVVLPVILDAKNAKHEDDDIPFVEDEPPKALPPHEERVETDLEPVEEVAEKETE